MKKTTVVFDLDGTLIDTLDSLHVSVNSVLARMGLDSISKNQCQSFIGNGAKILVEKSLRASSNDVDDLLITQAYLIYQEEFAKHCMHNVTPYLHIEQLLEELKAREMSIAILTNKPHAQAVSMTHCIFGSDLFELVQGQEDHLARKPEAESLYYVLERLGKSVDECVFIGDSEVDIQTGKNSGVFTIGVTWGFRSLVQLQDEQPDMIISNALDVLKIIEE